MSASVVFLHYFTCYLDEKQIGIHDVNRVLEPEKQPEQGSCEI
jgi:hypothetical protein